MGASPIGVPSANAGDMAGAKAKLRAIYQQLQDISRAFPLGSEDAKSMLSIMQTMNKLAPPSAEVPGVTATAAQSMNNAAQKQAAQAMLSTLAPPGASAGGGGGPAGPGMPPTPAMPPSLAAGV